MTAVSSTSSVPGTDRTAYWTSAASDEFTTVTATPRHTSLFVPSISTHDMGHLKIATIKAQACRVHRSDAQRAHAPGVPVRVHVLTSGVGILSRGCRHVLVGGGDLVVCDSTRPYSMEYLERFRSHLFSLPRSALSVTDAELQRVMATAIRPDRGVAAMLAPLLNDLATSASSFADPVAEHLAGNVTDLLATLIEELADGSPAVEHDARRPLVLRVRQYINHHLGDPHLTPETIAGVHHISQRYLHRVFEDEGTTVRRLVQQRRLAECRRELARRTPVNPTVSAVAHRWGFSNAAHFSKAFREAYGMSPTEWRHARNTAPK